MPEEFPLPRFLFDFGPHPQNESGEPQGQKDLNPGNPTLVLQKGAIDPPDLGDAGAHIVPQFRVELPIIAAVGKRGAVFPKGFLTNRGERIIDFIQYGEVLILKGGHFLLQRHERSGGVGGLGKNLPDRSMRLPESIPGGFQFRRLESFFPSLPEVLLLLPLLLDLIQLIELRRNAIEQFLQTVFLIAQPAADLQQPVGAPVHGLAQAGDARIERLLRLANRLQLLLEPSRLLKGLDLTLGLTSLGFDLGGPGDDLRHSRKGGSGRGRGNGRRRGSGAFLGERGTGAEDHPPNHQSDQQKVFHSILTLRHPHLRTDVRGLAISESYSLPFPSVNAPSC